MPFNIEPPSLLSNIGFKTIADRRVATIPLNFFGREYCVLSINSNLEPECAETLKSIALIIAAYLPLNLLKVPDLLKVCIIAIASPQAGMISGGAYALKFSCQSLLYAFADNSLLYLAQSIGSVALAYVLTDRYREASTSSPLLNYL